MFGVRGVRRVLVLGVALGVLATAVAPKTASAATNIPSGGCAPAGSVTLCWEGVAQAVAVGVSTEDLAATCSVESVGAVESTGVGCFLFGLNDHNAYYSQVPDVPVDLFVPGNAATNAIVYKAAPIQPYQLCIGAGYLGLDGVLHEWAFVNCFDAL